MKIIRLTSWQGLQKKRRVIYKGKFSKEHLYRYLSRRGIRDYKIIAYNKDKYKNKQVFILIADSSMKDFQKYSLLLTTWNIAKMKILFSDIWNDGLKTIRLDYTGEFDDKIVDRYLKLNFKEIRYWWYRPGTRHRLSSIQKTCLLNWT